MKIAEELFFDTGKADIKPGGKSVLAKIGNILKKIPEKISGSKATPTTYRSSPPSS